MTLEGELAEGSGIVIIYDGDCPLCSSYVTMTRLKAALGRPTLINARERLDLVKALAENGVSLDAGMAVQYHGKVYTGGEAVHLLAVLTSPVNFLNRLTACLMGQRSFALSVYPLLRLGRNILLKIRNRSQLEKPS